MNVAECYMPRMPSRCIPRLKWTDMCKRLDVTAVIALCSLLFFINMLWLENDVRSYVYMHIVFIICYIFLRYHKQTVVKNIGNVSSKCNKETHLTVYMYTVGPQK